MHLGEYKEAIANLLRAHDLSPDDKIITKDLAKAITLKKAEVRARTDEPRALIRLRTHTHQP